MFTPKRSIRNDPEPVPADCRRPLHLAPPRGDGAAAAYLHLVEPMMVGTVKDEQADPRWDLIIRDLRRTWRGVLILAGGYDAKSAEEALASGRADLIAFGRPFIANPDLPRRLRENLPLNTPDPVSFFGGDHRGYTDYPLHG